MNKRKPKIGGLYKDHSDGEIIVVEGLGKASYEVNTLLEYSTVVKGEYDWNSEVGEKRIILLKTFNNRYHLLKGEHK